MSALSPLRSPSQTARPGEPWPRAATAAVAIIGAPVRHSLSPLLHNAAFVAAGLDWAYLAFEVAPADLAAALAGAGALGLRGLSVTMPHKEAVAARLDGCLSATAAKLAAVNTVRFAGEKPLGESTDGAGFLAALAAGPGFDPRGERCAVLGAGGAGRAVVLALAEAGAADVAVVARAPSKAANTAALAGAVGRTAGAEALREAALVVNATPLGMSGTEGAGALPVEPELVDARQLVVDLVYDPPETPFLAAARRRGAMVENGLPMLVHQAALQFAIWTGQEAPLEAMWAAVSVSAPRRGDLTGAS